MPLHKEEFGQNWDQAQDLYIGKDGMIVSDRLDALECDEVKKELRQIKRKAREGEQ